MAKRKSTKKEILVESEVINDIPQVEESIVVSNIEDEVNDELIGDIEPIDMTEDLNKMKEEIFSEEKTEKVEEKHVEKQKINPFSHMFGFIWNGIEYD